jgi:hypothetical protein
MDAQRLHCLDRAVDGVERLADAVPLGVRRQKSSRASVDNGPDLATVNVNRGHDALAHAAICALVETVEDALHPARPVGDCLTGSLH